MDGADEIEDVDVVEDELAAGDGPGDEPGDDQGDDQGDDEESDEEAEGDEDAEAPPERARVEDARRVERKGVRSVIAAASEPQYGVFEPRDKMRTSDMISRTEMTAAIARRAEMISEGSPIFIDAKGLTNPQDIARKEFLARRNPLSLLRQVGMTAKGPIYESFKVRDMAFPS